VILITLAVPPPTGAEPAPGPPDQPSHASGEAGEISPDDQQLIDRILDLQQQIQDLRDQLSAAAQTRLDAELLGRELAHTAVDGDGDTESPAQTPAAPAVEARPALQPEAGAASGAGTETAAAVGSGPEPTIEPDSVTAAKPAIDGCNTLQLFDTSGDGAVSGSDRFWRYLRLWIDGNRDGVVQESEVQHPFDFGIVEISGRLTVFRTDKKGVGDIHREDRLYFEPLGKRKETGVLMVDASRIQRGDGLTLLSENLDVLEGLQAFRAGLSLRSADGETLLLNCP